MIFHQLFERETSTYTYLLADAQTREAVIIDGVLDTVDRDMRLIDELGLKLVYVIDTHVHADHVTSAGELRKRTGARSAVCGNAKIECADIALQDGSEIRFGSHVIRALATPGHTDSCMSFYLEGDSGRPGLVFTGDTLLIRGCGRTDFQQGCSTTLFQSVREKLFQLPPETIVYPGHDYKGFAASMIAAEMQCNPRLGLKQTESDFVKIMSELKLDLPKRIAEAVPANLACGSKPEPGLP